MNFETVIQSVSIFVALFYFFKFLFQKKDSSKLLAVLFLMLFYFEFFLMFSDILNKVLAYYFIPLFIAITITIGPIIYLYIRSVIFEVKNNNILIHFYPGIAVLIIDLVLVFTILNFPKITIINTLTNLLYYISLIAMSVGFIVQSIIYSFKSFKLINKYENEIGDFVSFKEEVSLKWLKIFLFGYLFFFVGTTIVHFIESEYIESNFIKIGFKNTFDLIILLYTIYIGIQATKQLNIQDTISKLTSEMVLAEDEFTTEIIIDTKFSLIEKNLTHLINTKKPYLNTSLTIFDLAKELDTNYKYVSQVINNQFDMNFASYINSYRINDSKIMLKDPKTSHYKIEAIAEMCGFKSKSAFNSAFKKTVGFTPSEFRDN